MKITFSWKKERMFRRIESWRIVKRDGVEVAQIRRTRSGDDGWYWYLTAKHRGDVEGPVNTLDSRPPFAGQAEAEAHVKQWLKDHPTVGVAPVKS